MKYPTCVTGKIPYRTIEKAEAITAIMAIRNDRDFRVYQCPECGHYHVTKQVPNREESQHKYDH